MTTPTPRPTPPTHGAERSARGSLRTERDARTSLRTPVDEGGGAAVEVRGLEVRYGEVLALRGTELTVGRGRVCGLVGMNGAGKTSLLRAVLGLVRPSAGQVLVDGATPERARRNGAVAYVPQAEDVDWDFPLSVHDVVAMGRYAQQGPLRRPRPADRAAVAEALERVGLAALGDRQIGALSGGQRKRAFVARAVAQGASLLLLDEPFAGVDTGTQEDLTALLRELAAAGATVLVSTHDLDSAPVLCDELALVAGTVVDHGDAARILEPASLARAFGRPAA